MSDEFLAGKKDETAKVLAQAAKAREAMLAAKAAAEKKKAEEQAAKDKEQAQ